MKSKIKSNLADLADKLLDISDSVGYHTVMKGLDLIERLERTADKLERKRKLNADQVKTITKRVKGFKRTQSTLCKRLYSK